MARARKTEKHPAPDSSQQSRDCTGREITYGQAPKLGLTERIQQSKVSDNGKSAELIRQPKVSDNGKKKVSISEEQPSSGYQRDYTSFLMLAG